MAKCIMVQGTMSGAGKSLLVTALCRIFRQDGWRVAPFKSQNMALNSFVTPDGLELGRAQAAQAEAAGLDCDVRMNPVLLKPNSDTGSQLIVLGKPRGSFEAREYFQMKRALLPEILAAYRSLAAENDILVIEGAGSPAEINLRADDIVNMGLAEAVNAPVLLVGDIDRGGVFAQLYGTVALLRPEERRRVVGTVINKFRGDVSLLEPGLRELEALCGVPVLGVLPWLKTELDEEDSLAPRLTRDSTPRALDIAVLRLPHLANFTDFAPLEDHPAIGLRYVNRLEQLGRPDLLLLPGTKNTMGDLVWLRESGFFAAIRTLAAGGTPVFGVCGGYQMLGARLDDPEGVERRGSLEGLGLLPVETRFVSEKLRARRRALCTAGPLAGARLEGYELHMGRTQRFGGEAFCTLEDGGEDGARLKNVFGSYLHGLFDSGELSAKLADFLAARRGIEIPHVTPPPRALRRERDYDRLADAVRKNLDLPAVYRAMEEFHA